MKKNNNVLFSALLIATLSLCLLPTVYADDAGVKSTEQAISGVNVNRASAAELAEKLDGIGEARAQLIIEYREKHGPFTSFDQLLNIKGIGAATLEKNRKIIQL